MTIKVVEKKIDRKGKPAPKITNIQTAMMKRGREVRRPKQTKSVKHVIPIRITQQLNR